MGRTCSSHGQRLGEDASPYLFKFHLRIIWGHPGAEASCNFKVKA